jgi:hypothetical protein
MRKFLSFFLGKFGLFEASKQRASRPKQGEGPGIPTRKVARTLEVIQVKSRFWPSNASKWHECKEGQRRRKIDNAALGLCFLTNQASHRPAADRTLSAVLWIIGQGCKYRFLWADSNVQMFEEGRFYFDFFISKRSKMLLVCTSSHVKSKVKLKACHRLRSFNSPPCV